MCIYRQQFPAMSTNLPTAALILVSLYTIPVLDAVTLFPQDGATSVPVIDDSLEQVTLPTQVVFHGNSYTKLYISENGMVTFDDNFYGGITRPLTNTWIAPFGADVVGNAGELKFQTFDTGGSAELTKASDLVGEVYPDDNFQATFAFVVSWNDVKTDNGNRANTFQLALSSDGIENTYAIFLYDKVTWYPAEIGASAGDGTTYFRVCDADKYGTTLLPIKSNSQCGTQGVIVFRLDQNTWQQGSQTCTPVYTAIKCRVKPGIPEGNRNERCSAGSS